MRNYTVQVKYTTATALSAVYLPVCAVYLPNTANLQANWKIPKSSNMVKGKKMNISYMILPYFVFFLIDYAVNWLGNSSTKSPDFYHPNAQHQYSNHIKKSHGGFLYKLLFIGQKNGVCLWYSIGQVINFILLCARVDLFKILFKKRKTQFR